MTKARKQSLMLVIALALILFLVVSIISATSNVSTAIAEDSSTVAGSGSGSGSIAASGDEGAIVIGDLMINGNVPDNYSVSGTPISTVAELQSFLKGEKGTYGYLTTDITGFSWSGSFTNILMAEDPETYSLIRAMLRSLRQCLSTHRIHLCMDEAEGRQRGRVRGAAFSFRTAHRHALGHLPCEILGVLL